MARNLDRQEGYPSAERVLAVLAPRLGARRAQAELGAALTAGLVSGARAAQALADAGLLAEEEAAELTSRPDSGACEHMVDLVIARARAARAAETREWP
jgi:hypothetical protein